jgi:hypothetical protein
MRVEAVEQGGEVHTGILLAGGSACRKALVVALPFAGNPPVGYNYPTKSLGY